MIRIQSAATVAALMGLPLSLAACSTVGDLPTERIASTTVSLANGVPAGSAQILSNGRKVTLTVALTSLAPGERGIHLHTTGKCATPDFASAGGHLNPLGKQHGTMNPAGKHIGDLPNIAIGAGGSGTLTAELAGTPDEIRAWLFDADGTAIVVHAGPDDYKTDPSGDSGGRVACGVLRPA